ncbi:hypothetical protein K435DRAFT_794875 [Dendrothele bispora CBS 962.96]|uniref:Uncharacterized protein n=1 Tax=Dendrothele bispora (strain CBS 962.96) TaxID=1314807 RepID=A0A4S8MAS0_DENBC|nr:hypothetical protein K435DRAFT_794875 [Dendrothele bispora CBS 962.96]
MPGLSKVWAHFYRDKAKYKNNKYNHKAYCKGCVAQAARVVLNEENRALSEGRRTKIRDIPEIEASVVERMSNACGTVVKFGSFELRTLKGQVETLWRYLRNCSYASEAAITQAEQNLGRAEPIW